MTAPTRLLNSLLSGLVVTVLALIVAIAGNGSHVPLEAHEVYVARTSEEMLNRHSLLVPYFNDVPRMQKPPLAYWLTIVTDTATGGDHLISEWEARIPSIAAGVLLAFSTLMLGWGLCSQLVGLIAAMLIIASSGYLTYTHNARPEMLYAALCAAALACFAWQRRQLVCCPDACRSETHNAATRSAPWLSWVAWVFFGLAILAKGPQLPLILLAGWCTGMMIAGERALIMRTLRPISGPIIAASISLWWFVLMWLTVDGSGDRMHRETLARIFQIEGKPLLRYLDPYYIYRIIVLILPWVVPYLLVLGLPLIRQLRMSNAMKIIWWMSAVTLAVMHLSLNRRWYYLLPLTPAIAVMIAWSVVSIGRVMIAQRMWGLWKLLAIMHVVVFVAAGITLAVISPPMFQPSTLGIGSLVLIAVVACVAIARVRNPQSMVAAPVLATCIVAATMMIVLSWNSTPWSDHRFARREFSIHAAALIPQTTPLVGWHDDWEIEQYYLHRPIHSYVRYSDLVSLVRAHQEVMLLTSSGDGFMMPPELDADIVYAADIRESRTQTLWHVRAR